MKMIKRKISEISKKGFTLVELLAVIVILAIIMLIAIPAVLNTLQTARKKAFSEYVDKIVTLAEQKDLSNELLQMNSSSECTVYDITKDLELSSTGDYKGYILVKKANGTKEYIITLWDDEYMLRPYNYTNKINHSNKTIELSNAIENYNESLKDELSISNLCGYGCDECSLINSDVIKGGGNTLYNVLKEAAKEGIYAKEYTEEHQDSMNKSLSTKNIYYWNDSDNTKSDEILEKNNVIFAGFCWQMIRTTDTGGVKMIYNGVAENNKCLSTRSSKSIGKSRYNSGYVSLADVGYMYNKRYVRITKSVNGTEYKYSKTFTWDGSKYILDNSTSVTFSDMTNNDNRSSLNNAHYTCWNKDGECTQISYIFDLWHNELSYINISDGKSIEDAKNEMLYNDDVNKYDSKIKTYIDAWYENNLIDYSSYLEDTIFCNNRSQSNLDTNGWNPNGGKVYNTPMLYESDDLLCTKETDRFSTLNNKAKLKYKIGLMSAPEMRLLNSNNLTKTGEEYWLMSPIGFFGAGSYGIHSLVLYVGNGGGIYNNPVPSEDAVRPAISLLPRTQYTSGDGSTNNPYIIN